MICRVSLLVLACLTASAAAFAPAPVYKERLRPKSLLEQMLGRWKDSEDTPRKTTLLIEKDAWHFNSRHETINDRNNSWRMHLDATQRPAALDLKIKTAAEWVEFRGIVKVEGDTLTFCFVTSQQFPRPIRFPLGIKDTHRVGPTVWTFTRLK